VEAEDYTLEYYPDWRLANLRLDEKGWEMLDLNCAFEATVHCHFLADGNFIHALIKKK
jgi:hypothetical protein